jgi:hypothetical protein
MFIPEGSADEPQWIGSHLYVEQWLFFEIGTLDQGTEVEFGVQVDTPDESVNLAIMDSTNYVAFESDVESFVGFHVEQQVRQLEDTIEIPYQQVWYFVVVSDTWSEIDIKYYVNVVEEDSDDNGLCGGAMVAGALVIMGILGLVAVQTRKMRS